MKFELDIDGEVVSLEDGDLEIHDPHAESSRAAALIFYWGSVAAVMRGKMEDAKADYRQAQATAKLAALQKDPKLAEWKCTAAWESTENFRQHKAAIAHWIRLHDQASSIRDACAARSSTIQTLLKIDSGAPLAAPIGGEPATKASAKKSADAKRKDKLRGLMRKKD